MQIFKIDKKIYWASELKSWLWTFIYSALIYLVLKKFILITNEKIIVGVFVILLLKFSGILIQYHVIERQIERQKKELTLILKSRMSGIKIKRYDLELTTSVLKLNTSLTRYLFSPFTLKLFLKPKEKFVINNRYGFRLDTLTSLDKILNSTSTQA